MERVILDIKRESIFELLQDLERLNMIEIIQKDQQEQAGTLIADKFWGILVPEQGLTSTGISKKYATNGAIGISHRHKRCV